MRKAPTVESGSWDAGMEDQPSIQIALSFFLSDNWFHPSSAIKQILGRWYIDLFVKLTIFVEVILSSTTATVTYSLFAKYQDVNIQIPPESCRRAIEWFRRIGDTPSHLVHLSSRVLQIFSLPICSTSSSWATFAICHRKIRQMLVHIHHQTEFLVSQHWEIQRPPVEVSRFSRFLAPIVPVPLKWYCWWFRNPAPVEVGSVSHYLRQVLYIPGGDRRISEPSTVGSIPLFVCEKWVGRCHQRPTKIRKIGRSRSGSITS